MKFNGKNHKNNQNRKNHKKANNIPLFKFEPLEERLMLSDSAAEWQTEIESINYAEHVASNIFDNDSSVAGVYAANADSGLYELAKLSDLLVDTDIDFQSELTSVVNQVKSR